MTMNYTSTTVKTPYKHNRNRTGQDMSALLAQTTQVAQEEQSFSAFKTPAQKSSAGMTSRTQRRPTASIDSRRFRHLENSIKGMTIIRQRFNDDITAEYNKTF